MGVGPAGAGRGKRLAGGAAGGRLPGVGEPTPGQIESYRRDGFLIVERFLADDELERIREHFMRVFEHEWETGLAPDEVNYVPGKGHLGPGGRLGPGEPGPADRYGSSGLT